ncbi:hypothetical protein [Ekhidna sp.]|jgi:hypothetical protein|uniref:Thoeris anti-defense Tad2 family protein n=1 Tax=Ekhidna sp. TaxID=2608089 RepID=UPI0032EDFECE
MSNQKYLADLQEALNDGAKVRRLGWPEGEYVAHLSPKSITVMTEAPERVKNVKVKDKSGNDVEGASVEVDGNNINALHLVDPKSGVLEFSNHVPVKVSKEGTILGWSPTPSERIMMDWVVIDEKEKK